MYYELDAFRWQEGDDIAYFTWNIYFIMEQMLFLGYVLLISLHLE